MYTRRFQKRRAPKILRVQDWSAEKKGIFEGRGGVRETTAPRHLDQLE